MKNRQGNFKFLIKVLWFFFGVSVLYSAPARIMPLGDSITQGADSLADTPETDISYRGELWTMMKAAGWQVDFVGGKSLGTDYLDRDPSFDMDNEGHAGWTSDEIAEETYDFLTSNPADTILLHIGTNDHSPSIDGVNAILDEIDYYEKNIEKPIRVIVAMIIDRKAQDDTTIKVFNGRLEKLFWERIAKGDSLTLVDMYRGAGLTEDDYIDNTHPNGAGYKKMANVWFETFKEPYIPELYIFPFTLVEISYIDIESISVDGAASTVDFITEIPDDGIIF